MSLYNLYLQKVKVMALKYMHLAKQRSTSEVDLFLNTNLISRAGEVVLVIREGIL